MTNLPRITNKRDFLAGLMFTTVGVAALAIASTYRMGTPVRMGPGFFPIVLTGLLVLLGVAIMASAVRSGEVASPRLVWRPLVVVTGVVALFAFLINTAGLALTTVVVLVASRLARPGYPWMETLALAVATTIVTALVFHYGLGLQLPLWPTLG